MPPSARPFSEDYARFLHGEALLALGNDDEALRWLEHGFDATPDEAAFRAPVSLRLGDIYERKGERQKAIDEYARFVRLWAACDARLRPAVEGRACAAGAADGRAADVAPAAVVILPAPFAAPDLDDLLHHQLRHALGSGDFRRTAGVPIDRRAAGDLKGSGEETKGRTLEQLSGSHRDDIPPSLV